MTSDSTLFLSRMLPVLDSCAESLGMRLWIVGGVVRDLLLRRSVDITDCDLVVEGGEAERVGAAFQSQLSGLVGGPVRHTPFKKFMTTKLSWEGEEPHGITSIDLASAREEIYDSPGAAPSVSLASLERDLLRRDFSINSLAISVDAYLGAVGQTPPELAVAQVEDGTGGLVDMQQRVLRIHHPRSFQDDPSRVIRGCRYLVKLDFSFAEETEQQLIADLTSGALLFAHQSRLWSEWRRSLELGSKFSDFLAQLDRVQFFESFGIQPAGPIREAFELPSSGPSSDFERMTVMLLSRLAREPIFSRVGVFPRKQRKLCSSLFEKCGQMSEGTFVEAVRELVIGQA